MHTHVILRVDERDGEVAAELEMLGDFGAEAEADAGDVVGAGVVVGDPAAIGEGQGAEFDLSLEELALRAADFEGGPGTFAGTDETFGIPAHGIDAGEAEFFARQHGAVAPLAAEAEGGLHVVAEVVLIRGVGSQHGEAGAGSGDEFFEFVFVVAFRPAGFAVRGFDGEAGVIVVGVVEPLRASDEGADAGRVAEDGGAAEGEGGVELLVVEAELPLAAPVLAEPPGDDIARARLPGGAADIKRDAQHVGLRMRVGVVTAEAKLVTPGQRDAPASGIHGERVGIIGKGGHRGEIVAEAEGVEPLNAEAVTIFAERFDTVVLVAGKGVQGTFVAEREQEIGGIERGAWGNLWSAGKPWTEGESIKSALELQVIERCMGEVLHLLGDFALPDFTAADDDDVTEPAVLHLQGDTALREAFVFIPSADDADGPVVPFEMINNEIGK